MRIIERNCKHNCDESLVERSGEKEGLVWIEEYFRQMETNTNNTNTNTTHDSQERDQLSGAVDDNKTVYTEWYYRSYYIYLVIS